VIDSQIPLTKTGMLPVGLEHSVNVKAKNPPTGTMETAIHVETKMIIMEMDLNNNYDAAAAMLPAEETGIAAVASVAVGFAVVDRISAAQ